MDYPAIPIEFTFVSMDDVDKFLDRLESMERTGPGGIRLQGEPGSESPSASEIVSCMCTVWCHVPYDVAIGVAVQTFVDLIIPLIPRSAPEPNWRLGDQTNAHIEQMDVNIVNNYNLSSVDSQEQLEKKIQAMVSQLLEERDKAAQESE